MKKSIIPAMVILLSSIIACNPSSVPTPAALCSGVHNRNVSGICHGSNNLSPAGYCSEANCHGPGLRGGNTGAPSCYSCHGPYWEIIPLHAKSIFGKKHWRDVCTSVDFISDCGSAYCHTSALTGNNGYLKSPGCNTCHGIPTADGSNCEISAVHSRSMDGARHHADVCTTLATCSVTDCHGTTLLGGTTGTFPGRACTRCHEHTPDSPGCDGD